MPVKNNFISIVIPVYNEAECIGKLNKAIITLCKQGGYEHEIIAMEKGSRDSTTKDVKGLALVDFFKLRRNFGQTAAMDCGIKQAQGELIITLDGDGQNDPANIPQLIKYSEDNGLDVISGWVKNRKDSFMIIISSRAATIVRGFIVKDDLHDSGFSFKVYSRHCFKGISLFN